MLRDAEGQAETPVLLPLHAHRLELRFADFDNGEFGRDEESVRRHQEENDPNLQEVMNPGIRHSFSD